MADLGLGAGGITDGVTANATDRLYALRDPTGTPLDRYITPAYLKTYIEGQANTWTAQQTITSFSGPSNVTEMRSGTSAQTFRVFNTYTDASNGEWLGATWSSNVMQLTTRANGTGSARALSLGVGATGQWQINTSGHLVPTAGSTYNIGTQVTAPVGNIFTSGIIEVGSATQLLSTGEGLLTLRDRITGSTFHRIMLGGTSSSYPAIKRSSTVLQGRLADDSDFCPVQGRLRVHANAAAETPTATHTLRIFDAAGTEYKVLCVAA